MLILCDIIVANSTEVEKYILKEVKNMKKTLALVLCMSIIASMLCMVSFADSETTTVVEMGSEWEYLAYEDTETEAPEGWTTKTDSETWETGNAPFSCTSYTWGDAATVFDYGTFAAFVRQDFEIETLNGVSEIALSIKYDEDPVVYINGTEVWGVTGYYDGGYAKVDLTECASAFKEGTNTIAVAFKNAVGGAGLDLQLDVTTGDLPVIDDEGKVIIAGYEDYSADGNPDAANPWGGIGAVTNMFDGSNGSVWGWGDLGIYVIVEFREAVKVTEIYLETKDEGSMAGDTSAHGTYRLEALVDDEWQDLGTAEALIEGTTFETEVVTKSIKVTIEEWNNDNWKSIAELYFIGEQVETPVEPEPTPDTPVEPEPTPDAPQTGDATVYAIVLAVVALMGMGVVVTKKVRA